MTEKPKDNGPTEEAQPMAIAAIVGINPQSGELGISYGPGISDKRAFLIGLNQLVAHQLMVELIEEKTGKKKSQIEIARGPIPNLRVKK